MMVMRMESWVMGVFFIFILLGAGGGGLCNIFTQLGAFLFYTGCWVLLKSIYVILFV